jgi:hypothetical protein
MSAQTLQTAQNANFLKMSALSTVRKERKGSKNGLSEITLTLTPCSLWNKKQEKQNEKYFKGFEN